MLFYGSVKPFSNFFLFIFCEFHIMNQGSLIFLSYCICPLPMQPHPKIKHTQIHTHTYTYRERERQRQRKRETRKRKKRQRGERGEKRETETERDREKKENKQNKAQCVPQCTPLSTFSLANVHCKVSLVWFEVFGFCDTINIIIHTGTPL